jgi:alpha-1,2-mannosyltransferase
VRVVSGVWRYVVGVLWFGLFAVAPIWWPPNHDNRELTWAFGDQLLGNAYLIAALAAVVLLAVSHKVAVRDESGQKMPAA